jgi:hypothetical protein
LRRVCCCFFGIPMAHLCVRCVCLRPCCSVRFSVVLPSQLLVCADHSMNLMFVCFNFRTVFEYSMLLERDTDRLTIPPIFFPHYSDHIHSEFRRRISVTLARSDLTYVEHASVQGLSFAHWHGTASVTRTIGLI